MFHDVSKTKCDSCFFRASSHRWWNPYRKASMMLGRLVTGVVKVRRFCVVVSGVNGWLPLEKVFRDDWYRVLITSNGHVNTAPKVPANLRTRRNRWRELLTLARFSTLRPTDECRKCDWSCFAAAAAAAEARHLWHHSPECHRSRSMTWHTLNEGYGEQ